jgi:hypothetical protein
MLANVYWGVWGLEGAGKTLPELLRIDAGPVGQHDLQEEGGGGVKQVAMK